MIIFKLTNGETVKIEKEVERFAIDTDTYMVEVFVKGGKKFYFPQDNMLYFYSDKELMKY